TAVGQCRGADPDAHGPPRGRRPGGRPRSRCRRLSGEAVRQCRAHGTSPSAPASRQPLGFEERAPLRRPQARSGGAPGVAGRPAADAHQDRVRPARTVDVERRHRALARDAVRTDLGLRLRNVLTLARRLHRLPALQARSQWRTSTRTDRPRRRLRGPPAVSLRWRIALILAVVALIVGAFAAIASYVTTESQLQSTIDETL